MIDRVRLEYIELLQLRVRVADAELREAIYQHREAERRLTEERQK